VGRIVVALFLGFFALLALGAAGAQVYGFTGRHERRGRWSDPGRLDGESP
jgi:hypothetical protein